METESQQFRGRIDRGLFNAAVTCSRIDQLSGPTERSKLKKVLHSTTPGGENTLLHLAASVGNLKFIELLLQLNREVLKETDPEVKPLRVNAKNAEKDTALHLAAQGGFSNVVKALLPVLRQQESRVDVLNQLNETALFKAYESGNLATVEALFEANPSSLLQRTQEKRTCLSVAVNRGDSGLVDHILKSGYAEQLIQNTDEIGNTVLHLAVGRNYVHIIPKLIEFESELCYWPNKSRETPLCVAAKLGHLEAVKVLIKCRPDAVEIPNCCGMNVLHLAAQVSQVRIVDYLNEKVGLSYLVNKGLHKSPEEEEEPLRSGGKTDPGDKKDPFSRISEGDTPLHIAARKKNLNELKIFIEASEGDTPLHIAARKKNLNELKIFTEASEGDTPLHIAARKKNLNMVNSLLRIQGINKFAVNKEGLTALDIARENTEYHESDKIIAKLSHYPSKRRPFLYSSPKVSAQKHKVAIDTVDKTFEDRLNTDLVVAVLIATMSFTAAFTVPGSFVTDDGSPAPSPQGSDSNKSLGSPILLGHASFKVFLIFDCVAFFLSLVVVLMWQMTTPITTGDKVAFLCLTNLLVCVTLAFTAYGFMLAVYSMLSTDAEKLSWVLLGMCFFICCYANLTIYYMVAKFFVKKARFNHLNGLLPILPDRVGEYVWMKLEAWGILDLLCWCKSKWLDNMFYCYSQEDAGKEEDMAKKGMAESEMTKKDMAESDMA